MWLVFHFQGECPLDRRRFIRQTTCVAAAAASWSMFTKHARALAFGQESQFPWIDPELARPGTVYQRIRSHLDHIKSVDTHEHLPPFSSLQNAVTTRNGKEMNLYALWRGSYAARIQSISPWMEQDTFETWWGRAKHDFDDIRATDFYRYMWLAFRDLYGVDFDHISDAQAADLNHRIVENYRNQTWLNKILRQRAGIAVLVCDRYWRRFDFHADYPYEFLTLNVTPLVWGFHPSEYVVDNHDREIRGDFDNPYLYAHQRGIALESLDDYLKLLDRMFVDAKAGDCVCLKTTLAYTRPLYFENVSRERAERAFGHSRAELTPADARAFEDFIMWRLAELSLKHEMPFQIHTGDARLEDSNPMLLVNFIEGNPKTKFELFHGGYPWVSETGAIGMKFRNVWINCVWLSAISYTTAKSAFGEWLEVVPSNRLTWGGDDVSAEGIYGETQMTRLCWAEVLAEKVYRNELPEDDALRIGGQIFRENALNLYPRLRERAGGDTV